MKLAHRYFGLLSISCVKIEENLHLSGGTGLHSFGLPLHSAESPASPSTSVRANNTAVAVNQRTSDSSLLLERVAEVDAQSEEDLFHGTNFIDGLGPETKILDIPFRWTSLEPFAELPLLFLLSRITGQCLSTFKIFYKSSMQVTSEEPCFVNIGKIGSRAHISIPSLRKSTPKSNILQEQDTWIKGMKTELHSFKNQALFITFTRKVFKTSTLVH